MPFVQLKNDEVISLYSCMQEGDDKAEIDAEDPRYLAFLAKIPEDMRPE